MPSGPIVKAIRCNIFQSRYPIGTSKSLENMRNHNEGSQQVGKTMSRNSWKVARIQLGYAIEVGLTHLASAPVDCFLDPTDFDAKALFAREAQTLL